MACGAGKGEYLKDYEIKPVRNAIVMLTNQCNCRCVYCFEQRKPGRMSLDTARDTLRFLHRSGSSHVGFTFFGGEPMLEFDSVIVPLVEWSRDAFSGTTRFAMTTNGTLFSRDRLDFLYKNNIRFMLSMDGAPAAQGKNRPLADGGNSFDAIAPHIPYILSLWPGQSFRETLTEYNAGSFLEDIRWFESVGCVNLMVVPDLFRTWDSGAVGALRDQLLRYEAYLERGYTDGTPHLLTHEYKMAFLKLYLLERFRDRPRRTNPGVAGSYLCGFGVRGSVSVDPAGDIYGCHHISPLSRDSEYFLGDVWNGVDEWRVRRLADRFDLARVGSGQCASCGLDAVCDGGCAPNNFQINGDEHKVPGMFCLWQRMVTDSAWRLCQRLKDNELFRAEFARCAGGEV